MPNDQKNIEHQRATLQKFKDLLDSYTKIYEEDGIIDSEEQKSIDEMHEKIALVENHLDKLESGEITDKHTEDSFSNASDSDTLVQKRAARAKNMDKIGEGVNKIEKSVGRASSEKIEKALEKYDAALATIIEQANEDGVVNEEEQQKIEAMEQKLDNLRDMLEESSVLDTSKEATEETKDSSNPNPPDRERIEGYKSRLREILVQLGLE